jgi:kynurenine formamidase
MDTSTQQRWLIRPDGANWGDFGHDDQLGRINLITAERRRAAAREIVTGQSFCLSLPLDLPGGHSLNPNRYPPVLRPTVRGGKVNFNCLPDERAEGRPDVLSDDLAILHLQYSTQWDSLAHVGAMFDTAGNGRRTPVYYNGFRAGIEVVGPHADNVEDAGLGPARTLRLKSTCSARALGVEHLARSCVQGRGVMVDLHARLGPKRILVGYGELMEVMAADGVEIRTGDILCLHTGFAELLMQAAGHPTPEIIQSCAVLDGRDKRLLSWIADSGVAAIVADNYAVEAYPADSPCNCSVLPLHHHCLFKLGIPLGELWRLTPLAQWLRTQGRNRFFLTAPPLNLPGAVGSPVTPVGTV